MARLRDGETRDDAGHASALARTRAAQQREIADGERCPECTAPYAREGGCRVCPECGYSPDCNGGDPA